MRRSLSGLLLLLVLSGCNLTTPASTPTPVPTPDLPRVHFEFPENGSIVYEGTELIADIIAEDESVGIERIEFYVNGVPHLTGEPESAPVTVFRATMNWVAEGLGAHTLSAVAYRVDGTPSDEEIIRIEVIPREDSTPIPSNDGESS